MPDYSDRTFNAFNAVARGKKGVDVPEVAVQCVGRILLRCGPKVTNVALVPECAVVVSITDRDD